jgi:hypothetical protein
VEDVSCTWSADCHAYLLLGVKANGMFNDGFELSIDTSRKELSMTTIQFRYRRRCRSANMVPLTETYVSLNVASGSRIIISNRSIDNIYNIECQVTRK